MTKYEEIKNGAKYSPNKYIMFAKNIGGIELSILPDSINDTLKWDIDEPKPNKNYYVDDGKFTIKVSTGENPDELEFTYYIKYNVKEKVVKTKKTYENFLNSSSMFMGAITIVVVLLLIFSLPILKGFFG